MAEQVVALVLCLIVPVCIGIFAAFRFKNWRALIVAAAVAWFVYLVFNLYDDGHSRDKEIMQGTWLFFQLTGGTFVALLAAACAGGTLKFIRKAPNNSSKRTREPRAT
jgi:H+/Cl- antiporter ClcA